MKKDERFSNDYDRKSCDRYKNVWQLWILYKYRVHSDEPKMIQSAGQLTD